MSIPGGAIPLLLLLLALFGFIAGADVIRKKEVAWSEHRTFRGRQALLAGWLMCAGFAALGAFMVWFIVHGV